MKIFLTRLGENVTVIVNTAVYAMRPAARRAFPGESDVWNALKKIMVGICAFQQRRLRALGALSAETRFTHTANSIDFQAGRPGFVVYKASTDFPRTKRK
ncbi:hypothetical protein KCP69_18580 [Salmonella enterica subsp. enterica]|nr:hypothetical protein KCP69_18580 [Salmonella enterica subsp. enterica]